MSDEFSFIDLTRTSDEIREDQEERLAKIQEIQDAVATAVGEATSEDERIKVTYTEAGGVRDITLDPRAMRMPSEDLAAELVRLVNAARADAQQQVQKVVQDSTREGLVDPREFLEKIPDIERTIGDLMQETQTMTNQLMTVVERMRVAGEGMPTGRRDSDDD